MRQPLRDSTATFPVQIALPDDGATPVTNPLRRVQVWHLWFALGVASCVVFLVLPLHDRDILYDTVAVLSAGMVIAGPRIHRAERGLPWYLFGAGIGLVSVGEIIWSIYDHVLPNEAPFPSIADAFYLAGAILMVAGLVAIIRVHLPGGDRNSVIDAAIVTTGAGVLSWVFLMEPYASDPQLSTLERAISLAYPLLDIAMLAVAARLVLSQDFHLRSLRLGLVGLIAYLVADVAYGVLVLAGNYSSGGPVDLAWLTAFICFGAAALHPSALVLTRPRGRITAGLSGPRMALLTAAALLAPAALFVEGAREQSLNVLVIGAGSTIMFLLILEQLHGLVRLHERVIVRERVLRETAAQLAAMPDRDAILRVARDAARALVQANTRTPARVRFAIGAPDTLHVVTGGDARHADDSPPCIPLADLPYGLLAALRRGDVLRLTAHTYPGGPSAWKCPGVAAMHLAAICIQDEIHGVFVIDAPERLADEASAGFEVLAGQVALTLERADLAEDLHQRRSEERFRTLVRNASDTVLIVDSNGVISYASPSVSRLVGYSAESLVGMRTTQFVHPDEHGQLISAEIGRTHPAGIVGPREFRMRHRDGTWRHVEAVTTDLLDDPTIGGIVVNVRDVTERKQAQEQLTYQAFHDHLTDLPNRALFMDRLAQALARAARRDERIAVLFVDLDRFKVVNDSLGHERGDELLALFGQRLRDCLRDCDTASRLGGDEFAVLIEGNPSSGDAAGVAERIVTELARPFHVGGREIVVTVSIGITLSRSEHGGPTDLLREADIAMYQAKAAGRARYAIFDVRMGTAALERLELEGALRGAVERGEFRVYYQPIIELADGSIRGFEALVRWERPGYGIIPPGLFVPLAEETGLILPIGTSILRQACEQAQRWRARYPKHPLTINVNLSARQFQHASLVDDVAAILVECRVSPRQVTLEITESAVMADEQANIATMHQLKALGVRLAIDDFGSGYTSLSYLKRFPLDVLKIDRSFVRGLGRTPEDAAIVRALTTMAHELGVRTTGEGVETSEQLSALYALGCDFGQGYYFARPMAADAAEALLSTPEALSAD